MVASASDDQLQAGIANVQDKIYRHFCIPDVSTGMS